MADVYTASETADLNLARSSGFLAPQGQFANVDIAIRTMYIESKKFLQDIDYATNILSPVNFQLILNNNAVRGTIPESNYTMLKSILPRYKGSRSTCLEINKYQSNYFLNTFLQSDKGTYGKSPNILSQTNLMTYCDWIDTTIPERNDTTQAHVEYILKDDGNIDPPNINKNSIYIMII